MDSLTPTPATTLIPTLTSVLAICETTLSVGGVLSFGPGLPVTTLTHAAVLQTPCAPGQTPTLSQLPIQAANDGGHAFEAETATGPQYSDFREPFYASTYPMFYVLAATTVTAYMLVIMLFITPRSFLDGGNVYLGRRGFTSSSGGGITIGGRPWLQKVAAMTVAISLTIATADTFGHAENQYAWGVQNPGKLQKQVMDSTELKVIRLVSDTFLWLAQAQTLIRLFPRQREKVIIKWTAFALITLQVIFSSLNSFYYPTSGSNGPGRPQTFNDAVPTLSYLFHLSLGLLYAAWVIYYALMKKRFAFYHPLMKNMILVSALSLFSILVPVVFFVLDISRPQFIGWGDYVRWVGAAAASVVVWEWVERIEALEREEKKDDILGREVFDGDDMMDPSPLDSPWLRRRRNRKGANGNVIVRRRDGGDDDGSGGGNGGSTGPRLMAWPGLTSIPPRYQGNYQHELQQQQHQQQQQPQEAGPRPGQASAGGATRPPLWPARPLPAVTPMSRTDTASMASTDYAVRYQNASDTTGRTPEGFSRQRNAAITPQADSRSVHTDSNSNSDAADNHNGNAADTNANTTPVAAPVPRQRADAAALDPEAQSSITRHQSRWRSLTETVDPASRWSDRDTPATFTRHSSIARDQSQQPRDRFEGNRSRWDFRARLEDFAATQAEKIRERMQPTPETDSLPVRVVPAPPRQGAALAQLLEEQTTSRNRNEQPLLERSTSEESSFSAFPGIGAGAMPPPRLGRTTSSFSQRSPGPSQSSESTITNPSRPPLWPGVRHRFEDDRASDSQTPAGPPRSR